MFKRLDELSDADVRYLLAVLIEHTQDIEVHLAEVAALVLSSLGEISSPGEDEYEDTVARVGKFLKHVAEHLKEQNEATEQLNDHEARKN